MGILTYTQSATASHEGVDWNSYSRLTNKTTLIFFSLERIIRDNKYTPFSKLGDILQDYYKNKVEKSDCNISISENYIEIRSLSKTLPTIWISKKI